MTIVVGRRSPNGNLGLLQVPDGKKCLKGDKVLVELGASDVDIQCQCDSFEASEEAVDALARMYGCTRPLKRVVGRFVLEEWEARR